MSKKPKKKKQTKKEAIIRDSYKTEWTYNNITKGRLDVIYSFKDAVDTLSEYDIYFYGEEYDYLIAIEIDEVKKTIEIQKRGGNQPIQEIKNNLITLIGHLPIGLNILAVYDKKIEILSCNNEEYDNSWEKGFTYYPSSRLFDDSYKPKQILLRLVKYIDNKQSQELFVLIDKDRAMIAKVIQLIKGNMLFDKKNLLEDGVDCFTDLVCLMTGTKLLKPLASEAIFKGIKDGTIKGRMQKAVGEDKKASIYESLISGFNPEKLMDVITAPRSESDRYKVCYT